ncbi:MAG TPA: hypothetical protein VJ801_09450, partial [Polyangia bacterium]|nr:hypothetical protein [Polyangia bacterium]
MKALSSSARLGIFGLCLIAALAAACSFDTSQLRALADGAAHPAVLDVRTAGNDGNSANPPD